MNREDIIKLAREAELIMETDCTTPWVEDHDLTPYLERFAALVVAAERNRAWTQDHWTEYERSIAAAEREACAMEAEKQNCHMVAHAIRARSTP